MDEIQIQITYKNKTYNFTYGSQAYIFHTGIYNDVDKKYGIKGLLEYVSLVNACYLKDSNRTPLGALSDYVATNFKKCRKLGREEILDLFYEQFDL